MSQPPSIVKRTQDQRGVVASVAPATSESLFGVPDGASQSIWNLDLGHSIEPTQDSTLQVTASRCSLC